MKWNIKFMVDTIDLSCSFFMSKYVYLSILFKANVCG
jgi:hypothetical protein